MKRPLLFSTCCLLFTAAALLRSPAGATAGMEFPSLASEVLATYEPEPGSADGAARSAAGRAFLGALAAERRSLALMTLDDPERRLWSNLPTNGAAGGVRLADCTREELQALCDLLASCLSPEGYAMVRDIALADDLLLRNGEPRRGFGVAEFWVAIFGNPDPEAAWGLQFDGHHLGLNLSLQGDEVNFSPSFLGAQPASFQRSGERVAPLEPVTAAAHGLLMLLSDEQRSRAIVGERRGDLQAGAGRDGFVPEREGLLLADLNFDQRKQLKRLLEEILLPLPADARNARLASLLATQATTHFSWRGPAAHPADVSFRLQGPKLIFEYACQNLGGDPLQHLHAMHRDPTDEYGGN